MRCLVLLAAVAALAADVVLAEEPVRLRMNPLHSYIGRIESLDANSLRVVDLTNPRLAVHRDLRGMHDLSEGYYVALVAGDFAFSTKDSRLLRVRVAEVDEAGVRLETGDGATGNVEAGEQIILFRPQGASTAQLEALPAFAPVDDGTKAAVLSRESVNASSSLNRSQNNLRQIGLAMHTFHDLYGVFPPAVVRGPDGKPWHSWRVLILPFLEEADLYNRYRFDEPWDGPNNKKLLTEMPEIYHDPIHGTRSDYDTHYAAVTGEGLAFKAEGTTIEEPEAAMLSDAVAGEGTRKLSDFTDGTSNTILMGSVSPDRKIPWMKPEDVLFEAEDFEPFGQEGFAAPYKSGDGAGGVFLFADGAVRTISTSVDRQEFFAYLTIGAGEVATVLPGVGRPRSNSDAPLARFIEVTRTPDGATARLVTESAE